jgi:hypothetical protein
MNPAIEMLKWMMICFAACAGVALVLILVAKITRYLAGNPPPPAPACPCGLRKQCDMADQLGVCNFQCRVRFVSEGNVVPRPSLRWCLGVAWLAFGFVCAVLQIGPIHGFTFGWPFAMALVALVWGVVLRLLWRLRGRREP